MFLNHNKEIINPKDGINGILYCTFVQNNTPPFNYMKVLCYIHHNVQKHYAMDSEHLCTSFGVCIDPNGFHKNPLKYLLFD
jgi:hypothetical protein